MAARYHAQVTLGGRLFENTVIDVGFDAPPAEQVDYLVGRDLLSFAGLPAVPIPTLPLAVRPVLSKPLMIAGDERGQERSWS